MALRKEDMLAVLEMGQVTGKPQLQLWGGTCRGGSTLGLRLYHEATPKEALLPPHSLLAPLKQRRLTAFSSSQDTAAVE